ncbi:hypothetical protein AGLY_012691 [Aphis glycines]|uniref:Uncharacterized protein n=1 Tax=Aphis glycines TaxID=307491 RepID=A0A6G0T8B4_APHGL|nr:hypothetical protein AGLY_012691 [Aphis glycines]
MRNTTVERLPIVITSTNIEQIIKVPQLERSTGEEQAAAVCNALQEWGLCDIVQALHHIYELILRSVFEIKIPEVTSSPAIPLFKIFQKQWHKLDINKYNIGIEDQACDVALENVKEDILNFVKTWFTCPLPNKSPNQDLQFIKDKKLYEVFDTEISRVSIQKLCNHLWYLTLEAAALSFFDDSIPLEVKQKNIDAFITEESLKLFSRFNIDDGFLKHDPTSWESSESYINGKKIINSLKIVNDTAERAVRLMEEYNSTLTLDEEQKQFILKCVQ